MVSETPERTQSYPRTNKALTFRYKLLDIYPKLQQKRLKRFSFFYNGHLKISLFQSGFLKGEIIIMIYQLKIKFYLLKFYLID